MYGTVQIDLFNQFLNGFVIWKLCFLISMFSLLMSWHSFDSKYFAVSFMQYDPTEIRNLEKK